MVGGVLAGLKVLEYAELAAGPYCGKLLAGLGAEVIKVEHPLLGDIARQRGPFPNDITDHERSGLFLYLNTDKLGITLNLHTTPGRNLFYQLVESADVVVHGLTPAESEQLGLDYETLRGINKDIIVTAVTAFGQSGPYKDYKGYDLNCYHGGGLGMATGIGAYPPEMSPVKAGGRQSDYHAALNAAIGTLGAVLSGEGQLVDISQLESIAYISDPVTARYICLDTFVNRLDQPAKSLGGNRRCKDGIVNLNFAEEHQWHAFVDLMGNPEWAKAEDLQTGAGRMQRLEEVNEKVNAWLMEHTAEEIYVGGQRRGSPVSIPRTIEGVAKSNHLAERSFFETIDHPVAGTLTYPGRPYRLSAEEAKPSRPAPLLGQHNVEIICERLGYSRQELARMKEENII